MFPKIFSIGDFFLPTYGLLVSLAFLAGLWLTARLARRAGMDSEAVVSLGIYCALGGIAGAKLLMFAYDAGFYLQNPREIFSLTTLRAGGVFYGGLVAALAIAFFYMRRRKLAALATADVMAPAVALGHAIGRIGCFAAGCCWGVECHRAWAVTFTNPAAHEMFGTPLNVPLHPTQLYESLAEAVICAILYRRFLKPHAPGRIIGLYLALYSSARFLVEFVRDHDQPNPWGGPLSAAQWTALALAAAGAWLLARRSPEPAKKR